MYYARTISLLFVVACGSGNSPSPADAAKVYMDAKVFQDAPAGMVCTGLVYDACNVAASNCMANTTCKTFNGSNFSVCTPTCGAATPCPMQNGQPVACNNMGICKPAAPNSNCTAP